MIQNPVKNLDAFLARAKTAKLLWNFIRHYDVPLDEEILNGFLPRRVALTDEALRQEITATGIMKMRPDIVEHMAACLKAPQHFQPNKAEECALIRFTNSILSKNLRNLSQMLPEERLTALETLIKRDYPKAYEGYQTWVDALESKSNGFVTQTFEDAVKNDPDALPGRHAQGKMRKPSPMGRS